MKKHALGIGILASGLMLVALIIAQNVNAVFLSLPMHWLVVGILPVILSLIVGGHLTKVKGLGIELEAAVAAPVYQVYSNLTASDAVSDIPGDVKQSIGYIEKLTPTETRRMRWLLFSAGRQNYYSAQGISQYLERMPNLEFLELRTNTDNIIGFLPIGAVMQPEGGPDQQKLEALVRAIETGNLADAFPREAVTLRVDSRDGLRSVLAAMRTEQAPVAAVISPGGRYLGVARAAEVEARIADAVLATS